VNFSFNRSTLGVNILLVAWAAVWHFYANS